MKKIFGFLFAFLLISLLLFSGCEQTTSQTQGNADNPTPDATTTPKIETPTTIGEVDTELANWNGDEIMDGYYVWFTLKNAQNEIIAADGKVSFSIIKDGSEIRKTNDIEVKASEFQVLKRKFGTIDKTVLLYSTKFETDKIDHTIYSVMVHFTTIEGKQINAEEIRG